MSIRRSIPYCKKQSVLDKHTGNGLIEDSSRFTYITNRELMIAVGELNSLLYFIDRSTIPVEFETPEDLYQNPPEGINLEKVVNMADVNIDLIRCCRKIASKLVDKLATMPIDELREWAFEMCIKDEKKEDKGFKITGEGSNKYD